MHTRFAIPALAFALAVACRGETEDLGVLQARVVHTDHPDSIRTTDSLVVYFLARPDIGNCFSESHVDVRRDSLRVAVTIWANARQHSPPIPPCGIVGYRYSGAPPFVAGWFLVLASQPDGSVWVDSVTVWP